MATRLNIMATVRAAYVSSGRQVFAVALKLKIKKTKGLLKSFKKTMSTRGKGLSFKKLINPNALRGLDENDRVILRMDTTEPDEDRLAYEQLIEGVTKSVTGLEELREIESFDDFFMTLSDAEEKVSVIHVLGSFGGRDFDHLLMVVKRTIYVLAVGDPNGRWKQVNDNKEYPIEGAVRLGFSGGYYSLSKGLDSTDIKVGFKELKFAIKRLIFEEPTAADFLTIAFNICEAVRFSFIKNQVLNLIGNLDAREGSTPCKRSKFLVRNWGNIALAIDEVKNGKKWKFEISDNIIDGEEFVTEKSVFELVSVIKKPSEEVTKEDDIKSERARKSRHK